MTDRFLARPSESDKSRISGDGLRYHLKASGSAFAGSAASNMSCLLCGRHRPRASLKAFKLAGAIQYRCADRC